MFRNKVNTDCWDANLYDESHSFVSEYGKDLIKLLNPREGENILDLGCGTGDLAKELYDMKVNVIGIDKSKNMVNEATSKYPNIKFLIRDVEDLTFNNEFDAVFSNAVLHWVRNPEKALRGIYKGLKQGGRFVAEFGGKGNVEIITGEIIREFKGMGITANIENCSWYYPSIGEYSSLMEKIGFRVTFAKHFNRPTPLYGEDGLTNWINMFCNSMFEGIDKEKKDYIISKVESNLRPILYSKGNWIADYKRIRVIGVKE